ncbi:MAG: mechanosensitive ion channel family protein [Actinomycetota bacterium]|nr:mechanosensitive ion channel family protein [Actinomycetota bacterium]
MLQLGASWPWALAQVSPERLGRVCGDDPGLVCPAVLNVTDNAFLATSLDTLLTVVLIVVLAWIAGRFVRRGIKRFTRRLQSMDMDRLTAMRRRGPLAESGPIDLSRATLRTETIGTVLRSISTFLVWAVALLLVLGEFDINIGPLIAGAGVAGVALGFGAQSLVKDFLSGVFMLIEDQYGVGDIIDVGEATGVVEGITLRKTQLRDVNGVVWHVPNGEISRIGNLSQVWSRALLDIGVAYHTDVPRALDVLKQTAVALWKDPDWSPTILEEPEVWGLERFDPDQLTLRMVLKTQPNEQWRVARELRARIKTAFDEADIEIPFPQRSLWIRSEPQTDGVAEPPSSALGTRRARPGSRNTGETAG